MFFHEKYLIGLEPEREKIIKKCSSGRIVHDDHVSSKTKTWFHYGNLFLDMLRLLRGSKEIERECVVEWNGYDKNCQLIALAGKWPRN